MDQGIPGAAIRVVNRCEATVTVVNPVVDAASGTFGIRLELPDRDHGLPAGLR
jgi:hypothetical protein